MEYPVILIVCDQLVTLKNIGDELLETLPGLNKFKNRCIYFENYNINSVPCSASRSVILTGKHINKTKVTDNIENLYQFSMETPKNGVGTFGTYFKNKGYESRFIGKNHVVNKLVPSDLKYKYKPRLSTENFLYQYDFKKYNKMGDFCYDTRLAFFNDDLVLEQKLQPGNYTDKCDYFDNVNCYDGLIPYLKENINKNIPFFVTANFDNPHDITNTNISGETDNPNLILNSMQLNGLSNTDAESIKYGSIGLYNENYNMYQNNELFNKISFQQDNCWMSTTNGDPLLIGRLIQLYSKYRYYGIDPLSEDKNLEYQTAYYRCVKQVDSYLDKIYDFLEENDIFSKAIICLCSDHGEYLCSHGLQQKASVIYREATEIPLFISYPSMPSSYNGHTSNIIISQINLLPTLLVLSKLYTTNDLNNIGLSKSFINDDGLIVEDDYYNSRLCLSMAFGPNMLLSLLNISEEVTNIVYEKIGKQKYLSIPTFSISSTININNEIYNGGYYFSLTHIFSQSIYEMENKQKFIQELNFLNSSDTYIMTDNTNTSIIAYIGTEQELYLMAFSDIDVQILYSSNIVISKYDENNSPYKFFVKNDNTYKTKIYSRAPKINLVHSDKIISLPKIKEIYSIINKNKNSKYTYIGTYNDLKEYMKYSPYIKLLFKDPVIVKNKSCKYNNYILNDTVFLSVQLWTSSSKTKKVIKLYKNFNIWITSIFNLKLNTLITFVNKYSIDSNYNFLFKLVNTIIFTLKNTEILKLPGIDNNVTTLLENSFQVQIFNKTNDTYELYNLADSSRINNNENLCNIFLLKLNENTKYNKLEQIYLSLPYNI